MADKVLDLDCRVVVQRVATGSTPFKWEVQRGDMLGPIQVSAERFRSMEAAYRAGQAWLQDFLISKQADLMRRAYFKDRDANRHSGQTEPSISAFPDDEDEDVGFEDEAFEDQSSDFETEEAAPADQS